MSNGNMPITREMSGSGPQVGSQDRTINLRLVSVVNSDTTGTILATTTIAYDGDGARVKKTDPSGTTYYLGVVEVLITGTTQVTTSYYAFGGAMVVMRTTATATLTYLHGDHLGSASLTTNAAGQKVSEQRYKPYGEVRWSSGAGMPTDLTFTGQRAGPAGYVGSLTDYVARFYSPALGRFISADTIVPGTGNSQAFNRYMYVRGNPLSRIDPSGHDDDPIADFAALVVGALDGWAEANMLGLASATGVSQIYDANSRANDYYAAGRVLGNLLAVGQGLDEMVTGASGFVGGVGLCPETVGGGCAVAIASGGLALHGAGVTLLGLSSTGKNAPGLKLTKSGGSDYDSKSAVQDFESNFGADGVHGLRRHGAGTTLEQQRWRASTGRTPDGENLAPSNATRWLDNEYLLRAYKDGRARWSPGRGCFR